MKLLLVIIDALAFRDLSDKTTPFLHHCIEVNGGGPIHSLFAYRGIEATIFTGQPISNHQIWLDFKTRTEVENPRHAGETLFWKAGLSIIDSLHWEFPSMLGRETYHKLAFSQDAAQCLIPSSVITSFRPSLFPIQNIDRIRNIPTLLAYLNKNNLSLAWFHLRSKVEGNDAKKVLNYAKNTNRDVLIIKIGILDQVGHCFGPDSREFITELKSIDSYIKRLVDSLICNESQLKVIFVSDHGMLSVDQWLNPGSFLEDFRKWSSLAFIDSTIARFWGVTNKGLRILESLQKSIQGSNIFTQEDLKSIGLRINSTEYGEIFFVLPKGSVFFPDYFRVKKAPLGMHGYYQGETPTADPFLTAYNLRLKKPDSQGRFDFIDVMPTILSCIGICRQESLLGSNLLLSKNEELLDGYIGGE